jgi:hypothetical protein
MIISDEQRLEFEKLARPMIKYLNDNFHPHVHVTIDTTRAELSEGSTAFVTEDYLKD